MHRFYAANQSKTVTNGCPKVHFYPKNGNAHDYLAKKKTDKWHASLLLLLQYNVM